MEGTRAPQGLDAEDRIALGLGASHLFYLVIFSMSGWALLSSPLPLVVRGPVGAVVLCAGVLLAWGRLAGRPLDRWIVLYVRYRLRPRQSVPAQPVAATETVVVAQPSPPLAAPFSDATPIPRTTGRRARRVAFYSQNGGCGKTSLAFESATLVASLSGSRVALLDLDFVSTTMRVRSGLDGLGLDDLLTAEQLDPPALESVLLRHPGGTRVVLGTGVTPATDRFARCVDALLTHLDSQGYEVVVMDIGTGALEQDPIISPTALEGLDAVYCVFNPTPGGVCGLYRAVATLRRRGLRERVRLVLNRDDTPVSLEEVLGDLRVELVASVPTLAGITAAERSHFPACLGDELVADALYPLAEDIFPDMSARWFGGALPRAQAAAGGLV